MSELQNVIISTETQSGRARQETSAAKSRAPKTLRAKKKTPLLSGHG
jgi:hypothetical protein